MNALIGDIISTKAKHRGIAGFILDGLVRDLPAIRDIDFPIFARGTTPVGPLHRGPGEIGYPICCGGVVVNPGNIIVADAAGVVVVPQDIAQELLHRLNLYQAANADYLSDLRREGKFSNAWVDTLLQAGGCPVEGAIPAPVLADPKQ
jgi:regulator of RNase E activity RraA